MSRLSRLSREQRLRQQTDQFLGMRASALRSNHERRHGVLARAPRSAHFVREERADNGDALDASAALGRLALKPALKLVDPAATDAPAAGSPASIVAARGIVAACGTGATGAEGAACCTGAEAAVTAAAAAARAQRDVQKRPVVALAAMAASRAFDYAVALSVIAVASSVVICAR